MGILPVALVPILGAWGWGAEVSVPKFGLATRSQRTWGWEWPGWGGVSLGRRLVFVSAQAHDTWLLFCLPGSCPGTGGCPSRPSPGQQPLGEPPTPGAPPGSGTGSPSSWG